MDERIEFLEGEITARKQLLTDSDYKCLKYAEGALTDAEYAPVKEQRQKWRNEIEAYQRELDELMNQ